MVILCAGSGSRESGTEGLWGFVSSPGDSGQASWILPNKGKESPLREQHKQLQFHLFCSFWGRKEDGDIKGLGLEKKRNSLSWNLSFYFLLAENQDKYLLYNITDKVQVPYQDGACFPKATVTRVFRDKVWTVRVPTGWAWPSILNRPASQTYNSEKQREERLFSDATLERGTNKSPSDHRPSPSWRSDLGFGLNRR